MTINEISHGTIASVTLSNGEIINFPPDKFRLIYNDEKEVISIRSAKYHPLSNSQIEGFFSRPVSEGLVNVTNRGTLSKGAKYYLQMELPQLVNVANKDVKGLLTALDSRTGNNAFALTITPIFVVCNNTWASAYSQASLRIAHMASEEEIMEKVIEITEEFTQGIGYNLSEMYNALGKVPDSPGEFLSKVYSKELAKDPNLDISELKDYGTFMELYESHEDNVAADVIDAKGLQRTVGIYTYMVSNKLRESNPIDLVSSSYARGNKLARMERAIVETLASV